MKFQFRFGVLFAFVVLGSQSANAFDQPSYCSPEGLAQKEITSPVSDGLVREHVYQLGSVKVAGLAVGQSQTEQVVRLATQLSTAGPTQKYCTWYLNDGDSAATEVFNFRKLKNPMYMPPLKARTHFMTLLDGVFDTQPNSFLQCAREHGYIALGCDGMMHRGPTVFGMLLAFSGCSPENSANIVNQRWGLNFVHPATRLEVIKAAFELGRQRPGASTALRELFTAAGG